MDKSEDFRQYREKYKEFHYNSYNIVENEKEIHIEFEFEIPGLAKFNPTIKILKKDMKLKDTNSDYVKNMVFNIGLIELISYWKSTCAPKVVIKCGYINKEQKKNKAQRAKNISQYKATGGLSGWDASYTILQQLTGSSER